MSSSQTHTFTMVGGSKLSTVSLSSLQENNPITKVIIRQAIIPDCIDLKVFISNLFHVYILFFRSHIGNQTQVSDEHTEIRSLFHCQSGRQDIEVEDSEQ